MSAGVDLLLFMITYKELRCRAEKKKYKPFAVVLLMEYYSTTVETVLIEHIIIAY